MSFNQHLRGITSQSGQRYIHVPTDAGGPVIRLTDIYTSNTRLPAMLAEHGVMLSNKKDLEAFIQSVGEVDHYHPSKVAEYPGWTGSFFAQHDGTVIGAGDDPVHVVFSPKPQMVRKRGSLEGWKNQVAQPIKHQPLAACAVMAAFLPAVLRFMPHVPNFTIEIVGRAGTGKSTIQKVAASVAGPPDGIIPLRDLQRNMEVVQWMARDFPLVIDHAQGPILTASKAKRPELFSAVAYDLPRSPGGRVALLSGQHALRDACGIEWSEDNLITLRIPDTDYGAFAFVPDGFATCADFADSLIAAASANYGHAYSAFLRALREKSKLERSQIESQLAKAQVRFLEYAETHGLERASPRLLRAFAAIYAAGCLAWKCKILPTNFCRSNLMAVLDLCVCNDHAEKSFADRLEELVVSRRLIPVDKKGDAASQCGAIGDALGTITIKADCRVIKISPGMILSAFPDWERIKRTDQVREVLKVDGKNLAAWGRLAHGMERERLFQFVLPLEDEHHQPEPTLLEGVDESEG